MAFKTTRIYKNLLNPMNSKKVNNISYIIYIMLSSFMVTLFILTH